MDSLTNANPHENMPDLKTEVFEWIEALATAIVIVMIVLVFLFRIAGVDGDSMNPTLYEGDRIIISPLFYKPAQGDIVVVTKPNPEQKVLIKRIIAVGGQTVDINTQRGLVYVDGVALDEPYILEKTYVVHDVVFPVTVPEGHVFVMGDNRNNSKDSRYSEVGMVDERYLMGRCILRVLPLNKAGIVK